MWAFFAWRRRGALRIVWTLGALLHGGLMAVDLTAVLAGQIPVVAGWLHTHAHWTSLGLLLLVTAGPRQRYHLASGLLGIGWILLGAIVPAVVTLGLGRAENMRPAPLAALVWLGVATWVHAHAQLQAASLLAPLSSSIDASTVAAAWSTGGLWLCGWALVGATLADGPVAPVPPRA